jgi:hypothetical protein
MYILFLENNKEGKSARSKRRVDRAKRKPAAKTHHLIDLIDDMRKIISFFEFLLFLSGNCYF